MRLMYVQQVSDLHFLLFFLFNYISLQTDLQFSPLPPYTQNAHFQFHQNSSIQTGETLTKSSPHKSTSSPVPKDCFIKFSTYTKTRKEMEI